MASPSFRSAAQPLLSPDQVEQFVRDGYVTVPALLPPEGIASCARKMWESLEIAPNDPATWPADPILVPHQVNSLMAPCRTKAMEVIAEQLVGPRFARGGGFSPVLNFPRPGPRQFLPLGFHIDGINQSTAPERLPEVRAATARRDAPGSDFAH